MIAQPLENAILNGRRLTGSGALSRSVLTLKTPKDPIVARFRVLAERAETFA